VPQAKPVTITWLDGRPPTTTASAKKAATLLGVVITSVTIPCGKGGGIVRGVAAVSWKGQVPQLRKPTNAAQRVEVWDGKVWVPFPSTREAAAFVGAAHSTVQRALGKILPAEATDMDRTCRGIPIRYGVPLVPAEHFTTGAISTPISTAASTTDAPSTPGAAR